MTRAHRGGTAAVLRTRYARDFTDTRVRERLSRPEPGPARWGRGPHSAVAVSRETRSCARRRACSYAKAVPATLGPRPGLARRGTRPEWNLEAVSS
ncbi:unnamed protein product [Lampetra planeri]